MLKCLFIFGTRPEAIKMAPLILELKKSPELFDVSVCVTGQHRNMLDQVLSFFQIKPDYDLNLMKPNQTLFDITADVLKELKPILEKVNPHLVFVQGDTTTAFSAALSSYYSKIPIVHIEAGLRSQNKYSPYPEEINRVLIGHLADYHFAPTPRAQENLFAENIRKNVFVVGNTVIDALFLGLKIIEEKGQKEFQNYFSFLDFSKKIILVTGHRRESFGKPFENICLAIKEIAKQQEVQIVYPVHLNPNVKEPVYRILSHIPNIFLIEPLDYPYLIWLLNQSYLVLTDSGGIQEEAPSLGKPVLVMREVTERTEGIEAGTAKLVGSSKEKIVEATLDLLHNKENYQSMAKAKNPYGDGKTSLKIKEILLSLIDSK